MLRALGDHEALRAWSGKPRAWGPEGAGWRAWFGGKVVDGLCEVIDEHLAAPRCGYPAAIGCVPWLDSEAVVDRLLALRAFCVVVDKGNSFPGRLRDPEKGFPNIALLRLRDMAPSDDGSAPILGPFDRMPEHELEHAVSERMLARIDAKLGYPKRDPHGDPIPAADGQVPTPPARQLSACHDGDAGTVARISDADPEMLRYFDSVGISLDSRLRILARRDFAGMISVAIESADGQDTTVDLGSPAAQAIWVVAS